MKLLDGGYVPLIIAGVVGLADVHLGARHARSSTPRRTPRASSLEQLIAMLKKSHPARAPGTAVFLTSDPESAPAALLHNLKHNHVLHERNVIVTVTVGDDAAGARRERVEIERIWRQLLAVRLTFGYMETPNVPKALALARRRARLRDDEHLVLPEPPLVPASPGLGDAGLAGRSSSCR